MGAHICTYHKLNVWKTIRWDAAENPGFMAALLNYLCTLHSQSPVFGGAQFSRDYLVINNTAMPPMLQERKVTQYLLNIKAIAFSILCNLIFGMLSSI